MKRILLLLDAAAMTMVLAFSGTAVQAQDADGKPLGTKSAPAGYRRGLTLPSGWKEMADPILIPEGLSDVLAGLTVGLSAIGRPSNSGGVEYIAQLCRHRQVIVLAENDRKPDGRWPGKEGAEAVARRETEPGSQRLDS